MTENYITMHDEIMKEKWVISGPLMEVCVLSHITEPREQKLNDNEKIENRHNQLKTIINKLREIDSIIEILETNDRINFEIEMLEKIKNSDGSNELDIKAFINIGYKRKGRIIIKLMNERIIKTTIMYDDYDYRFKHTRKLKQLLNKTLISINGICGSIGHENDLSSIIQTEQLHSEFSSFFDVKWNRKAKYYG